MTTPSTPLLELRQVSKVFERRGHSIEAVRDISLAIAAGEFVCLLGPSGCGKSTILNLAAGFEQPTRGEVLFRGQPVRGPGPERAVVFQEAALFPWLTVLDNLCFGPRLNGMSAAQARQLGLEYLQLVGLTGFERQYPAELSGGMKQRVGIARVLMMEPPMLLMDEPFGALDAQTRSTMQELLVQLWERFHQAVLFITHDVEEAIFLADTVYVMTPRPGQLRRRFPIELPRPRTSELIVTPEFNAYKREIRELLRIETQRAPEAVR
jgi:NitT/TauT family transport system ATP-binding protein